jgi:hypothetical protein
MYAESYPCMIRNHSRLFPTVHPARNGQYRSIAINPTLGPAPLRKEQAGCFRLSPYDPYTGRVGNAGEIDPNS